MKGEIELYNISFLILKVELHFNLGIWCRSRRKWAEGGRTKCRRVFSFLLT